MYLLDAEAQFFATAGVVKYLSGLGVIPEMIVVGITNIDRKRDFTPSHTLMRANGEEDASFATSGGADAFIKFLQTELIPHIDSNYQTMPYRIIVGHSLGGLLALHAMAEKPALFPGVIVIDPSIWWDQFFVLRESQKSLAHANTLSNSAYIALSNRVALDNESFVQSVGAFSDLLKNNQSPGLRSRYQNFDNEDHQTVPLIAIYSGLVFMFEGYRFPYEEAYENPSIVTERYRKFSAKMGMEFKPPEPWLNYLGHSLLRKKNDVNGAIDVFRENVEAYPKSSNAYESLAEAYLVKGDKSLAIQNYEKAIELFPDAKNAHAQLKKLEMR